MFTIGVFGIITDDKDRVLLCHRRDFDLWNLPGGGVEAGESPWAALVREIEEETGLNAVPIHLSGVYSKPDKNEIVLSFFCQVTGGAIQLTDEADQIEYFHLGSYSEQHVSEAGRAYQGLLCGQDKDILQGTNRSFCY